jgi:N-acetylmuramoyl-L-alanine amidase CwlA
MALVQSLITQDKYGIKCPYSMQPKGICVHNTANDAPAKNEISYMKSNNMEVSFHVAIDDVEAIQGIPFNRNAWACGDGANGEGNRNYIQIEICYSKSGGIKFANAEKRAAKEIAALLKQYGWTINNVKKHQDFSNKYCPHRTLDNGWKRFLTMIEVELSNLNKPANTVKYRVVTGSFSSLENANARVKELKAKGFDSFILAE